MTGEVEKEGFDTGRTAVNPFSNQRVPIWVGGSSPAAVRRAATRGDGWLPQGDPRDRLPAGRAAGAERVGVSAWQSNRCSVYCGVHRPVGFPQDRLQTTNCRCLDLASVPTRFPANRR